MSILGTWDVWFKWENTGAYNSDFELVFQNDGRVAVVGPGYSTGYGKWAEESGLMIIRFDDGPRAVYTGNVALDSITGMQSTFDGLNQFNGYWYAVRKSNNALPSATARNKEQKSDKYSPMIDPKERSMKSNETVEYKTIKSVKASDEDRKQINSLLADIKAKYSELADIQRRILDEPDLSTEALTLNHSSDDPCRCGPSGTADGPRVCWCDPPGECVLGIAIKQDI